jgi:hypothetical protein
MTDIQLVGMTRRDLQKAIGVYKNVSVVQNLTTGATVVLPVAWLPADIINNTIRANSIDGTTSTGYLNNLAPTGRFIAPAGYGGCVQKTVGQCGFRRIVLYGPSLFKTDATVIKRIAVGEKRSIEMRVSAYDVLNHTNWRVGSFTSNVNQISGFTGQFGQYLSGWNYQDPSGSNDPGGRILDYMIRFNF